MKFAHFSDVHLGSWSSSPELREFSVKAFKKAINISIKEKVDFVLIAGDLYDTPLPSYDVIASSATILKKCKDAGIRVYVVPGSHDYSPSEKTFITVLENAGLLVNVAKIKEEDGKITLNFTEDPSGAKITGLMGKAGSLEREYFKILDRESLEKEEGFKIFLFHSGIEEYKPKHLKEMPAVPLNLLPKGFDYYATGHVHHASEHEKLIFPGVLFPTETKEMEEYISSVHVIDTEKGTNERKSVKLFNVITINVDATGKSAAAVEHEILERVREADVKKKMLIINCSGTLETGGPSDVNFATIIETGIATGAFSVKKNFNKLVSKKFESSEETSSLSVSAIESKLIEETTGNNKVFGKEEAELVKNLLYVLNDEKQEGETVATFEERIKSNLRRTLEL
jgi:DNA repair protein SbcD/Mre11